MSEALGKAIGDFEQAYPDMAWLLGRGKTVTTEPPYAFAVWPVDENGVALTEQRSMAEGESAAACIYEMMRHLRNRAGQQDGQGNE